MKLTSASCQFAYWKDGELRIANFLTRRTFAASPVTLDLIRYFFKPRTIQDALVEFRSYSPESVASTILQLIEAQLLLEQGSAAWKQDKQVDSTWRPWLPEAGFHFMTKDTPYGNAADPIEKQRKALPKMRKPPQFKTIPGIDQIHLPAHAVEADTFFETLHARRTHRTFAKEPVPLDKVSHLLQTTWGVQGFLQSQMFGRLPLKTSPSGGSRHPGEVYLMALRVKGLKRGLYHYHARDHYLGRLPGKASARLASAFCADQGYFGDAAAMFIMTAVFTRNMWKYGRARAYRVVHLETGHLCQTFCLTATRLGLAPFSTAALKDTLIEKTLRLDGNAESVVYLAGIGVPDAAALPNPYVTLKSRPGRKAAARARA